jgi:ribosomal protein S12 methylthiotransferase accessory factor
MGIAPSSAEAASAAIGEVTERHCSMGPPTAEGLVRASFRELSGQHAVAPRSFALPSGAQYRCDKRLRPFNEDTDVEWCRATSLTEKRETLVPTQFVYLERISNSADRLIPELTTTGCAAHVTWPQAALRGVLEVLERDAVAIWWHTKLRATPLDVSQTALPEWQERARVHANLEIKYFSLPTDGPFPVVFALAERTTDDRALITGAACAPTILRAATKAMFETIQVAAFALPDRDAALREPSGTSLDRGIIFRGSRRARMLYEQLGAGKPSTVITDDASADGGDGRQLQVALDALHRRGDEVLMVDITRPEVRPAGFHVIRIIIPAAVDASSTPEVLRLGARRLRSGARTPGGGSTPDGELNLTPVPLP